jgi:UPF0755 protein
MAGESAGGRRSDRNKRRRQRRRGGLSVLLSLLVLLGLVGGAGYVGVKKGKAAFDARFGSGPDYDGRGGEEVVVQVKDGDTVGRIGRTLAEHDVVASVRAFSSAAADNPKATSIQPGFYSLRKRMKASLALELMLSPASRVGALSIPEGWRASKIVEAVASTGGIPKAKLQAVIEKPAKLGLPAYAKGRVEGFLFPARYDVNKKMTPTAALAQMVTRYRTETADLDIAARSDALGVTPYEAVIVASLVQAEARHKEDFGKVARVVYNRLESKFQVDRRLQFDSTINYARNSSRLDLTTKEIEAFDSPYNTYTHVGLPPTPIGNPGRAALVAALNPPKGNWRYFVTVDTKSGETRFTDDYDEFLKWKAEFKRNHGQ